MVDAHIHLYHRWRLRALAAALNPGFEDMSGIVRFNILSAVGRRMTANGMFGDWGKADG